MTYGSNIDTGEATISLTKDEHERFKARKPVSKFVGSAHGEFKLTVKLTKRRLTPEQMRAYGHDV